MTTNERLRPLDRDDHRVLDRLREAKEEYPALADIVDLYHDLIVEQAQVQVHPTTPHYSPAEVQARFGQGVPLLRPQDMALDWETYSYLYRKICHITSQHRPDLAEQLKGLTTLLNDDPDDVRALTTAYLEQGRLQPEIEEAQGELLSFVLVHTLRPFLRAYADALSPAVEEELWQRGRCPVCGGEPDLAFLDDASGARHLVCSRCDTDWRFPRVKCPFCNTLEPSNLSYYPGEDEKHRIYVCQNCQRYLKAVDLRKARRRFLIPVERITTMELDITARREGYL